MNDGEKLIALDHARRLGAAKLDDNHRPPEYSDDALALRFAGRHAEELRYVAAWNRWLRWDGRRWAFDDTLAAFDLARAICREAAAECDKAHMAQAIASAHTVAAVATLARADRRIAATVDQWDADPWSLNTPAGIVDLRTGELGTSDRDAYCTKITTVAPAGDCPMFRAFLARITDQDRDLESYLQRLAGYGCSGSTREHMLAFGHGAGANGKTTFVDAISGALGDYAATAPIETFVASNTDRHPTELAGLRGARLVTAVETEEGRHWAEARIKTLTGGDRVAARFMRQDFFTFAPQFTLFVIGNHRPGLRTVDEAIRRRLHLIPFNVTIPKDQRDKTLGDQLRTEAGGILRWMIDGALDWQEHGLHPPEAVRRATDAYLDAEDATAAWIDECCERDPTAWERSSALFASWKAWAARAGEQPGTNKRFGQALETRGVIPQRTRTARGFTGLRIAASADQDAAWWDR